MSSSSRLADDTDDNEEDDDNDHAEEDDSPTTNEEEDQQQHSSQTTALEEPAEHYRDFYLSSTHEIKITLGTPPPKRKGPRGGVTSAFPVKLHEMLSRGQYDGTDHIVSWQVHGRAFTVHQPTVFVEELMPQ